MADEIFGGGDAEPDPTERLNKIGDLVVEACYLAQDAQETMLLHFLKMALTELHERGAFR